MKKNDAENEALNAVITNEQIEEFLNKRFAEILLDAEKKANEIIEAAEKRAGASATDADIAVAEENARLEEYVDIKLFKDNNKYKEDVFVSVNGENCVIPRGKLYRIKRKFALLLEQSDLQDTYAADLMDKKEAEFALSAKENGII